MLEMQKYKYHFKILSFFKEENLTQKVAVFSFWS